MSDFHTLSKNSPSLPLVPHFPSLLSFLSSLKHTRPQEIEKKMWNPQTPLLLLALSFSSLAVASDPIAITTLEKGYNGTSGTGAVAASGYLSSFGETGVGCGINWEADVSYGGELCWPLPPPFSLSPFPLPMLFPFLLPFPLFSPLFSLSLAHSPS